VLAVVFINHLKIKYMSIMLGNQSVSQIEKRLGIEFPEEIREFMNKTHQSEASNIAKGKWHCFDLI
jgi:cell wall assembly regulator SMI1